MTTAYFTNGELATSDFMNMIKKCTVIPGLICSAYAKSDAQ